MQRLQAGSPDPGGLNVVRLRIADLSIEGTLDFHIWRPLMDNSVSRKGAVTRPGPFPQLSKTIEDVYRYPLRQSAIDTLNRQLRAGISDEKLAELAMALRDDDRPVGVTSSYLTFYRECRAPAARPTRPAFTCATD